MIFSAFTATIPLMIMTMDTTEISGRMPDNFSICLPISSLCTVFAESEVINYIGEGQKREDIAAGVVDSVANKVAQLAMKKNLPEKVILTGGLSNSTYFTKILSQKLGQTVSPTEHGRYAGALGAALLAKEKKKR